MDTSSSTASSLTNVVIDGTSYTIDLPFAGSDYIQGGIRSTAKPYELEMLRAMADSIDVGDLVIDVGANIGNHTLYLAAVRGAQVIAYEPDRRLTDALSRSVRENRLQEQVLIRPVAVADTVAELVLVDRVEGNLGGQRIVSDPGAEGQRVPLVRLDDELPDQRVRAVKIDVEGYELNVLDGAQALLERDHPELWIECLDADHYRAISGNIAPLGYRCNGVFNPSPTYHFVHDPRPSSESFTMALDRIVERLYADHSSYVTARESLLAANAKYRAVTQQYGELRDRLFSESSVAPQAEPPSLVALRHAEQKATELQDQIEILLAAKSHTEEIHLEKVAHLSATIREAKADRDRITRSGRQLAKRVRREAQVELDVLLARANRLETQLEMARTQSETLYDEIANSRKNLREIQTVLNERDVAIAHYEKRQSRYRSDFDVLRDYVARTDVSLEKLDDVVGVQAAQIDDLEARHARALKRHSALETELAEQQKLSRRLTRARDAQRNEVESRTAELRELTAQRQKSDRELGELKKHQRRLMRARDAQRNQAESRTVELLELAVQHEKSKRELGELKKHQQRLMRARDAHHSDAERLRGDVADYETQLNQMNSELETRDRTLKAQETELDQARTQIDALRSSRAYRVGIVWSETRSWRGFWTLIPRLLKISSERNN